LWQPADTAFGGRCVYGELGVPVRAELARARTADERNEARRLFYRLLNAGTAVAAGERDEAMPLAPIAR
jgi:hypothetical protein